MRWPILILSTVLVLSGGDVFGRRGEHDTSRGATFQTSVQPRVSRPKYSPAIINGKVPEPVDKNGRIDDLSASMLRMGGTCSAVAVGTRCALSAKHCLYDEKGKSLPSVSFRDRNNQDVGAEQGRIPHPTADFVIIKLTNNPSRRGLRWSQIATKRLSENEIESTNKAGGVRVMGFGYDSLRRHPNGSHTLFRRGEPSLHAGNMNAQYYEEKSRRNPQATLVLRSASCSPEIVECSAPGDSGGGAFVGGQLHGILTDGNIEDVRIGHEGVYSYAASLPDLSAWLGARWDAFECNP